MIGMLPRMKFIWVMMSFFLVGAAQASAASIWSSGENPRSFLFSDEHLETRFTYLRLSASVDDGGMHKPWSDTFWPGKLGGITYRFMNGPGQGGKAFKATHPTLLDLKNMSADDLRRFSPAEKFDIAQAHYDYPLTNEVLKKYHPDDPNWIGICHGWTAAAINYPEPEPVSITNPDGIVIEFGSSDIKALMAFFYAWRSAQSDQYDVPNWGSDNGTQTGVHYWQKDPKVSYFEYHQLGIRCDSTVLTFFRRGCKQTSLNPASFHLALANLVGNYQRSFVVDVDPSAQVWNQPILSYETSIIDRNGWTPADPSTDSNPDEDGPEVNRILVRTVLNYVVEVNPGYPSLGPDGVKTRKKYLKYWLMLDAHDHIIGGKWSGGLFVSSDLQSDSIGFAWRASRVPFTSDFEILNSLYKTNAKKVSSFSSVRNSTPGLEDVTTGPGSSNFTSAPPLSSFLPRH